MADMSRSIAQVSISEPSGEDGTAGIVLEVDDASVTSLSLGASSVLPPKPTRVGNGTGAKKVLARNKGATNRGVPSAVPSACYTGVLDGDDSWSDLPLVSLLLGRAGVCAYACVSLSLFVLLSLFLSLSLSSPPPPAPPLPPSLPLSLSLSLSLSFSLSHSLSI